MERRAAETTDEPTSTTSTTTLITRTITIASQSHKPTLVAEHEGYSLQGCYTWPGGEDGFGDDFAMPLTPTVSNELTPALCMDACLAAKASDETAYEFVALGMGRDCFCGTALSSLSRPVGAGNCTIPCSGDNGVACGGSQHVALYSFVGSSKEALFNSQSSESLADVPEGMPRYAAPEAVVLGSLSGFGVLGLLAFLGWRMYARRRGLPVLPGPAAKATANSPMQHHARDPDSFVAHAPAPGALVFADDATIHTVDSSEEGFQASRQAEAEAIREGIVKIRFQAAPKGPVPVVQVARLRPPPPPPSMQASNPAECMRGSGGLHHRRRSSSKPVDWAKFDTIIADGRFSPLNSPTTRERLPGDSRRMSHSSISSLESPVRNGGGMAVTSAIQHPSLQSGPYSPSRDPWLSSLVSPARSDTTVGTSILDSSPTFGGNRSSVFNDDSPTLPSMAAAGSGLGERAWHRRRNSTPFPPKGIDALSAKRRSSIAGDYGGVRIGKVDEAAEEEEEKGGRQQLVPEPLNVVKGGDATRETPRLEDDSPILPLWAAYHTVR